MNLFNRIFYNKNIKLFYYLACVLRSFIPSVFLRAQLKRVLRKARKRSDFDYIMERVNYYNKLSDKVSFDTEITGLESIKGFKRRASYQSVYFFDSVRYLRWFDPKFKFGFAPGDVTEVPELASILKSKPLCKGDNTNSIVLKLDRVRHFVFLRDELSFADKKDMAVFRLALSSRPHRILFMQTHFESAKVDAGIVIASDKYPKEWLKPYMSMYDHLKYKFILAIEGKDVATNLKWIMSTNSLAVMPKPKYETWFMEGKLIADYHYVEIKDDYSDLEQKIDYYIAHPEKAEQIARNANEYIDQFRNRKREKIISLLVLDKYFRFTGQLP